MDDTRFKIIKIDIRSFEKTRERDRDHNHITGLPIILISFYSLIFFSGCFCCCCFVDNMNNILIIININIHTDRHKKWCFQFVIDLVILNEEKKREKNEWMNEYFSLFSCNNRHRHHHHHHNYFYYCHMYRHNIINFQDIWPTTLNNLAITIIIMIVQFSPLSLSLSLSVWVLYQQIHVFSLIVSIVAHSLLLLLCFIVHHKHTHTQTQKKDHKGHQNWLSIQKETTTTTK